MEASAIMRELFTIGAEDVICIIAQFALHPWNARLIAADTHIDYLADTCMAIYRRFPEHCTIKCVDSSNLRRICKNRDAFGIQYDTVFCMESYYIIDGVREPHKHLVFSTRRGFDYTMQIYLLTDDNYLRKIIPQLDKTFTNYPIDPKLAESVVKLTQTGIDMLRYVNLPK